MNVPQRRPALAPAWHRRLYTLETPETFPTSLEPAPLREALECAARDLALGEVRILEHRFQPQGVSLVLFGGHLRAVLHTWPEHGRATLDVVALAPEPAEELAVRLAVSLSLTLREE